MKEKARKGNKKTVILIAVIVLAAAWFIIGNTILKGYSGTFALHDGHDWTEVEWKVLEGDAGRLSVKMEKTNKLKVKYDGEWDLVVKLFFSNAAGESAVYELHIYEEWDLANDNWQTVSDLTLIE